MTKNNQQKVSEAGLKKILSSPTYPLLKEKMQLERNKKDKILFRNNCHLIASELLGTQVRKFTSTEINNYVRSSKTLRTHLIRHTNATIDLDFLSAKKLVELCEKFDLIHKELVTNKAKNFKQLNVRSKSPLAWAIKHIVKNGDLRLWVESKDSDNKDNMKRNEILGEIIVLSCKGFQFLPETFPDVPPEKFLRKIEIFLNRHYTLKRRVILDTFFKSK